LKVIWVLENIEQNINFYSKLHTSIMIASIRLWKRYNPEDYCVLYCDAMTHDLFYELQIECLWDEIIIFQSQLNVNKKIFWASAKLEILHKQREPVIILDNDTHVFCNIKKYLDKDTVYVHNHEIGQGYYPTGLDEYVRKLSYKGRWKTESVNVSFLYLPNPSFTQKYAKISMGMMEEFTQMNVPHSQYLIFSEQLLLKHLLEEEEIKYKSIISTDWDCKEWEWGEDNDKGIWKFTESGRYIKHYGPLKGWIIHNKADQNYEREMKHLENCINFPNLDLSIIKKP